MKMALLKIMLSISTMVPMMKTPMSMGIMLMVQTSISTMLANQILNWSWIPMIMFLMMIGGMLILFMYMSSIASNEKFSTNISLVLTTIIIFMLNMEPLMLDVKSTEILESSLMTESQSLMKMYNKKTFMLTLLMFLYLILTMIVVTMLVKMFKGPLRAKYE